MKRLLLVFAILLLLAGIAFAADGTWTNATEDDKWDTALNWTGGVPGSEDTATFNGSELALGLPTVNRPDLSATNVTLVFSADYSTHDLSEFSSGASCNASHTEVTAGGSIRVNVDFNAAFLSGGTLIIKAATAPVGNVSFGVGDGTLQASGAGATLDGWFFADGGNGIINWTNLTIQGGVDADIYAITHQNTTGATLICDQLGDINLGGDAPGLTISTTGLAALIQSTRNETVYAFNHSAGTFAGGGFTWIIGVGGFTPSGTSIFSGTFTVDLSASTGPWTQTAGTLAAGAVLNVTTGSGGFTYTALTNSGTVNLTAGAEGFTMNGGTYSGTWNVDLSGGAGAYTQTAGTIDADAVLNVTTGTGAITYTALTKTGTGALNITATADANIGWNAATAGRITLLTINAGKTLTQSVAMRFKSRTGAGTLAGSTKTTTWSPGANGDVCDGPITGTGAFGITLTATPLTIATSPSLGSRAVTFYAASTADLTLSGITCGDLIIAPTAAATATLTLNGNSSGAAITLGSATATTYLGAVVFGAGYDHTWTGAIARAGTGTANALNPQGRCIFTGTFTGTGITVTPTYEGQIDCVGVGRVTAVTATGNRLVVRRATDASGNPVRSWNGDSCVNTRFLGRRVIGQPDIGN